MILTGRETLGQQGFGAIQQDEEEGRITLAEGIAIRPLQRGTGDDHRLAAGLPFGDAPSHGG